MKYPSNGISLHIPLWGYNNPMTYTCKVCGVTSDVAEFYKGVNTRCKECHKKKVRENRNEKAEYYKIYDAWRYQKDPNVKKRHRRYRKTEGGKAALKRSNQKWKKANAEKRAAHVLLGNAVRDGRVKKPDSCEICGDSANKIHGHHENYSEPLHVQWVCPSCHVELHRAMDNRLSQLHAAMQEFTSMTKGDA